MRSFLISAAALAFGVLLAGCNTGNGVVTVASTQSNLRVVNLIPNASGPIVTTLDDNFFLTPPIPFQSLSAYQIIEAGTHTLEAFVTGAPSNLIATTVVAIGEANYTYILFGPITNPVGRIVDDTFLDSGAGSFNLRVINAAAGIGAVDIYLTAPGASLDLVSPSVAGIDYNNLSGFASLPIGNLQLRITRAGSKSVIYDSVPFNYQERAAYEIVVYSRGSGTLPNVMLLAIDSAGSGTVVDSLLAQFKVINASLVTSPLNVFFDGVLRLSNIPVAGATGYQRTTKGAHTLTVEATATPGATLLTYTPTLTAATDSSVVLEGTAGAMQALLLQDNNLPPGPGNARVRVVNTSPDLPAIDVFVNFSKQISGLPQNSGAFSLELTADAVTGTTYQFSFNVACTSQTLLTVPALSLVGGKTYTLYVVGPSNALQAGLTQDN